MTPRVITVACLAGAAMLIAWPVRGSAGGRLRRTSHPRRWLVRPAGVRRRGRLAPAPLGAGLAGLAGLILVDGPFAPFAGAGAAVLAFVLLRRLPSAAQRAIRQRVAADLPLAVDLVAAALLAGAPVERAVAAVGGALGGPIGERLAWVARTLRLGGSPAEAWQHLGAVEGAAKLTRAATRAAHSGVAFATALQRLAGELRAGRVDRADAAARRAAVLVVLPLGLCFLPAFVLAGLVPVVMGVLGGVL